MNQIVSIAMNPAVDKFSTVPMVISEIKLRCTEPIYEPGGGGINVARVVKILGEEAEVYYPLGGPWGQLLEELLKKEEVFQRPLSIEGWTRENLSILETKTGKQYRLGMPGPTLNTSNWQQVLDSVANLTPRPAFIVGSGSLPPGVPQDFYARLASIGKGMESKVVIDTSGEALFLAAEEGCYLLKPNVKELCDLMGREFKDEIDQYRAAKKLIDAGAAEVLVVSLGAAGALLVTEQGIQRFRSPTVPIQSKVGAGDSMVGGMVVALIRGKSLEEAVTYGVAAGAAAVMTPGSKLCRREDVEKLYEQMRMDSEPWEISFNSLSKTA